MIVNKVWIKNKNKQSIISECMKIFNKITKSRNPEKHIESIIIVVESCTNDIMRLYCNLRRIS